MGPSTWVPLTSGSCDRDAAVHRVVLIASAQLRPRFDHGGTEGLSGSALVVADNPRWQCDGRPNV